MDGVKTAWESKYNVPFSEVADDLIFHPIPERTSDYKVVTFGPGTRVIVTDGNVRGLDWHRIILSTNRLYGFMCEFDGFHDTKINRHMVYFADYRVYGKPKFYESFDYVKKLPFDCYRKGFKNPKDIGMMYVTFKCRYVSPDVVDEYHRMSGCSRSLLVVPYRKPEFDGIPGVEQVVAPVENLFDRFGTYIYTPVSRHFDCSPRLVTECFFHGKRVMKELDYMDPGLEVRYSDAKDNLPSLELKDGDMILEILKS